MGQVSRTMPILVLMLCTGFLSVRPVAAQNQSQWYRDYQAGLDKAKVKDYKGAIPLFRKAINGNPTSVVSPRYTPNFYLGLCYDAVGDQENAAECYAREAGKEAIKSFPEDLKVLEENFDYIQAGDFSVLVIDRTKPGQKVPDAPQGSTAAGKPGATKPEAAKPDRVKPDNIKIDPKPPPPDPDCDLKRCLAPFLRGNYKLALEESGRIIRKACPDRTSALFIAGASHYSLFLLSGQKDMRAKAEADKLFAGCGGYKPPKRWVSPAVLSYYEKIAKP